MAILFMCVIVATVVKGQYPGSDQVRLDPTSIPQFVDFLPHFAGLRVNAQAGGDLIVRAVPTQQVALSTGTVLDNGVVGTTPGAGFGNYFVYSISKDGGNSWTLPLWPSFTIEARRGNSLNVTVRNNLYGVTYQDVNIPADQTIMMSGVPLTGDPMTEPYTGPVPIALHLHGGEVPSTSDGGPDAWFTPGYAMKGRGFENGVDSVLFYPNTQEAATLWYHEHSQLGLTRVNVYAGMAGFYFLRGFDEEFDRLPGWSKDDLVKEVTPAGKVADALHPAAYLPEIEIVIQDRMFDTKGQLFYEVEPTNPSIHPFWTPEFFGDVITVNGKSWPYLSVAPRKYRFHMLNGSNARFYNLWIQNLTTGVLGPVIRQVGTDGGLMDNPARIDPNAGQTLLLGNGERADIVIDFSAYPPGTVLTLMNNAPAPYPDGDPVTIGTTDRIMQFVVNGKMVDNKNPKKVGIDKSLVPNKLRIIPMVKLTDWQGNMNVVPDKTRQLTLNEVATEDGPTMVLLNNSRFEDMPEMGMFGAPTETPVEGTTEEWQLINMTMDAHPMHMHLVQFQLVSRQSFDVDSYRADYMNSFSGVNGGMEGMYMGAEGPPFLYNVPNSDGAVGGNLPVTPYLQGTPAPPDPNERGWKDVIKIFPGQVMTYVVRFAPTDLPVWWPKFFARYSFDPSEGPGYVWHCHIVEHEDNDMMRPLLVQANPSRNYYKETPPIADNTVLPGSENPKANADFVLAQNYPNPFNDQTVINFRIPEEMHVQLKLYNQMGVEVKTLIDGVAPSGNQTVYMYCDDLPGGIYYYQLLAGEFNCTKKMVVAR
jgi:spore coat protein A, manganese oxidase